MAYETISEIQYQGKAYIDLANLAAQVREVYPVSIHSLRRYAKQGKIPYKRSNLNNKLWFDTEEATLAINRLLGDPSKFLGENEQESYLNGL